MNAWPDAAALTRYLGRVRRRLLALRLMEGAAVGCLVVAVLALTGRRPPTGLAMTGLSLVVVVAMLVRAALGEHWRLGWWRSPAQIARQLESRTAEGRNLIVTAAELVDGDRDYVRDLVLVHATRLTTTIDPARLFPVHKAALALAVAILVLALSMRQPFELARVLERTLARSVVPAVGRMEVTVIPPSYSGVQRATVLNPSRVEALAASRIEIRVEATASSVILETLAGTRTMERRGEAFHAVMTAESDGFLAIEPRDSSGAAGARQLVGLAVTPDRPPHVTLASPGRDLFFSTVPDTIPVTVNADDDLALASLRLRYTAVSGSGERFTFTERDVPLTVNEANPRSWTARGSWRLAQLGLAPGDLVVYRAVATDKRPGSAPVESESYVLEVVTPGAIAAEGFAADDQRDRYAVSQQMVILKTERLIARRASMVADSVTDEARLLAAEQRQVRAEFVFMMGGEVEDLAGETAGTLELNEVAEAESEGDLLAGRLQNRGRIDMTRAIRSMSRASTALTEANLDQALTNERSALDNLMRAFARSRFILRALTQRERIDLERRLSGSLNLTAGLSGPAAAALPDTRTSALRRLLADVAGMSSEDSARATADRATEAALAVLRADASSDTLRNLASRVQQVAAQARVRSGAELRTRVDSLVHEISALLASSLPMGPRSSPAIEAGLLQGALRDALRREARRP